ncbi:DNA double-strand break repair Rad50 ATPase [uncultured archaeon]|nr:DNA double-strand break repair Rad50 ATPase [uncultured archaeon]
MRLNTLFLSNWVVHRELSVDLSGGLQIEGRNGTGKSSVLEAVRFVFTDSGRGFKELIRHGERSATVRLSFSAHGAEYEVEKTLHVEKASTAVLLKDGVVVADNVTSVRSRLNSIVDAGVFEKLLYVQQDSFTRLVEDLSRKGGRQSLDSLFGLDKLDGVYAAVGEDIKLMEGELNSLQARKNTYPADFEEALTGELSKMSSEISEAAVKRTALEADLVGVKERFAEADVKLRRLESEERRVSVLRERLSAAREKKQKADSEVSACKRRISEMAVKRNEFERLKSEADSLDKVEHLLKLIEGKRSLDERRGNVDLEGIRKKAAVLGGEVASLAGFEVRFRELDDEVKSAVSREADVKAALEGAKKRLLALRGIEGVAKCPTCGQPLSEGHLLDEEKKVKGEISSFEAVLNEVSGRLKSAILMRSDAESQANLLTRKRGALDEVRREISCAESLLNEIDAESKRAEEALVESGYDGQSVDEIKAGVRKLHVIKGNLNALSNDLAAETSLRKELTKAEAESLAASSEAASLEAAVASSVFNPDDVLAARRRREELLELKYSVESDVAGFKERELSLRKEADRAREKIAEFRGVVGSLAGLEKRISLFRRAREVYHSDKGLPRFLRTQFMGRLNYLLSRYFGEFNENPRYQDVFFSEDYEINLKTPGGLLSAHQLSGGEKVQLALALRIALVDMLSPARLLILDEPFGSLDVEHREILGCALSRVAENGQLILVSHVHVDGLDLSKKLVLESY